VGQSDGRDKAGRDAWECESLGQNGLVTLVREFLAARLQEQGTTIEAVQERERELVEEERRK
jgi:hypothetical protein